MAFKTMWFGAGMSLLLVGQALPAAEPIVRDVHGTIPPVLFSAADEFNPSYPVFVSASAAVDEDGDFDPSFFHPHVIDRLKHLLSEEWLIDGCYRHSQFYFDELGIPDRSTLKRAIENSPVVAIAEVVARDYGFQDITPGQLLEVKIKEGLKGSLPLRSYFIFLPVGEFGAGPFRICKTDPRYPEPPLIGEKILVMVPRQVNGSEERFLHLANSQGLVVLEDDNGVRLPSEFERNASKKEPLTATSVVELARRITLSREVR